MSEQPGRDAAAPGGAGKSGNGDHEPPGPPAGGTKLPSAQAEEWHRALISVYYYGRQNQGILGRHAPPIGVRSLAYALSVLHHAPVGPVRMALADICRTRAARPTSLTLKSAMDTLLDSYKRHLRRVNADERILGALTSQFEGIFSHGPLDPEEAYAKALGYMVQIEPNQRRNGPPPSIASYSVTSS